MTIDETSNNFVKGRSVYVYTYMYMCVCIHIYMCVYTHICVCKYMYTIYIYIFKYQFSSVQLLSPVQLFQPHGLQHARLPYTSLTSGACSNSCLASRWCHPAISSSIIPFFSCLQSFPAWGSFPVSQFFVSGKQSIGASASTSVQFSSVTQSCPTLCNLMECSMPGCPVHHQLPELPHTHVHGVGEAIQPSHPLLSLSPSAFNLSQHQGLF